MLLLLAKASVISLKNKVIVWYLDSWLLGDSNLQDWSEQYSSMVVKLDLNEIFQISMNGPSLNLIFLEKLKKNRKKKKTLEILDFIHCTVHLNMGQIQLVGY